MSELLKKFLTPPGPPREVAPRTYRFVASTGEVDRDGDILEPAGWVLDNYLRNPVILVGHDQGSLPVARAARVWVESGRLEVDVEFPAPGTSEASDEAHDLVAQGFLRAVSVSFRPLVTPEPLYSTGGHRYTRMELFEISLVSLPANASALAAALGGKAGAGGRPVTMEAIRKGIRAAIADAVKARINRAFGRLD